MSEKEQILAFLLENNIPHKVYEHEICNTIEEKAALDEKLGITARHCKNLFLTDRKKEHFYLLVMPFEKTFRTAEVSRELHSSRLSFASDDMLWEKVRCRSGSLSTLCLIFDKEEEIGLAIDADLLSCTALCFHPADNKTTVVISTSDCLNMLFPRLHKKPSFVTVTCPTA
mgnify:CR=1 FL=1